MKKVNFLFIIGAVAMLASCNSYQAKTVTLDNMNDSLNYTLGVANGAGIKQYYLQNDSTGEGMVALLDALNDAFNGKESGADGNELFELGKQIGSSLKMQEKQGLIGNKDIEFNMELVMQGLINGLNEFEGGMQSTEARTYFQTTIEELRAAAAEQATVVLEDVEAPEAE